jgi:hypothetical protein
MRTMLSSSGSCWSPPGDHEIITGHLSNLDANIVCEAILPYLERLTDLVNLSHTSKFFRSIIFSGRTSSIWSSSDLYICVDATCRFGCGRVSIHPCLAWSILRFTSTVSVRLHLPFSKLGLLLEAILSNRLQVLRYVHLRFRIDEEAQVAASILSLDREMFSVPIRRMKVAHLTVYGYPNSFNSTGSLDLLLHIFGLHLETLQFMETSPICLLKTLQKNVCPSLSNLSIQGEQLLDDLLGLRSETLRSLTLHDTAIKLSGSAGLHSTLQFPNLMRLELVDRADSAMHLWKTEQDVRECMVSLPSSLKDLELRIDSRLANSAIIELSKRLSRLENLALQLPDKDENGPDDISYSAIAALKHGCPSIISLEITDGLIGFDVDAFVALKDFRQLRKIKLLYDDIIVDALPRLLEESLSDSIDEVEFFENAGEISLEDEGTRWYAMEERLVKMSSVFTCVTISLSDCWWT